MRARTIAYLSILSSSTNCTARVKLPIMFRHTGSARWPHSNVLSKTKQTVKRIMVFVQTSRMALGLSFQIKNLQVFRDHAPLLFCRRLILFIYLFCYFGL